jgi:hypothetical protein
MDRAHSRWGVPRTALVALLAWLSSTASAVAVTVDFDAGSGIALSYTENGITVASDVQNFYVRLGDNDGNTSPDLANNPGCCSTPYRFTHSGGVFSVARWDFNQIAGTHTFTASSGSEVVAGSGTVAPPPAGWTGITYFTWNATGATTDKGVMDNLEFCPGDCDDGNPCTTDSCDPDDGGADGNGCVHAANNGPCTDGLFCNGADTCSGGACDVHAGDPCISGSECADACDEDADSCFDAAGTPCTADANTCTDDECDGAGACTHPGLPDGSSCSDGNTCTENDECASLTCVGTPTGQTCDDGNICTLDTCDPMGGCIFDAAGRNGFACDDGNTCTQSDACSNGMCQGFLAEADTDADGFCDRVENDAGCNIGDFMEIPPRSNIFAGAPGIGPGEGLTTWAAPGLERVPRTTDPACTAAGVCGPVGFCTAGQIWDPCLVDADCDQPADTCRLVVNFAEVADLTFAFLKTTRTASATPATPATPGCSRKIDFTLDPSRTTNRIKIKTTGTIGGRRGRDADRFRIGNF